MISGSRIRTSPTNTVRFPIAPATICRSSTSTPRLGWHKPAFDCAHALVGIEHRVYGSDYFMSDSSFMHRTNTFLESLTLSKSDKEKIYSENALRFLRL
ncbi:MAG: amidohydrolase family protein [Candidatus Binatia bacterium]